MGLTETGRLALNVSGTTHGTEGLNWKGGGGKEKAQHTFVTLGFLTARLHASSCLKLLARSPPSHDRLEMRAAINPSFHEVLLPAIWSQQGKCNEYVQPNNYLEKQTSTQIQMQRPAARPQFTLQAAVSVSKGKPVTLPRLIDKTPRAPPEFQLRKQIHVPG